MYELTRVRLFSVGPTAARYQDVALDLRGVGAPVKVAVQEDLFAPDALDRTTPRRPSPASVLFLENGGGKSVLLKLIFSVLLPGRRQVVGTTSTTVLENFVLAEDVAHVVCEWMHVGTGRLLVTGKVSEWRGHVASTDPEKLADAWYSFRPVPGWGSTTCRSPTTAAGSPWPRSGSVCRPRTASTLTPSSPGRPGTGTGRVISSTSGWTRSCSATSAP